MIDLQKMFTDQLQEMQEAGEIKSILKTHLTKAVNSAFDDVLRWGKFPDKLKAAILDEVLQIDLSRLTAMDYTAIVTDIVKSELENTMFSKMKETISKNIKAYTGALEKTDWEFSEIVQKFIDEIKENKDPGDCGEISLHIKERYGSIWVYFDEEKDKSEYQCDYKLAINESDGKVFSFSAKGYDSNAKSGKVPSETSIFHRDFDAFMFKLWAEKAIVKMDDNHSVEWSTYDND